ncbi:hypothetical protein G7Y89_g7750 [Cudoniella acicularis]|uniref:Calcium channel YVC1-like C-terminal transmembrane domain-containing protein n=1 Tax=Cudoniella acicularis TaxID=354080 RepID=A0A8H4W1R4_9HELO|nr:hypothetical protein G7Y89_g7750 [Cudoniella acicularis]
MTAPAPPIALSAFGEQWVTELPTIGPDDHFVDVVRTLSIFFVDELTLPSTFEQFRTTAAGNKLRHLVDHLAVTCKNPVIISALLTLKWHFSTLQIDDPRINETRAVACEIVAWRFLTRISERDAVDFCLYEIPPPADADLDSDLDTSDLSERSSLLPQFRARDSTVLERPGSRRSELEEAMNSIGAPSQSWRDNHKSGKADPTSSFTGLTGLEIAVVADCKKFLSQQIIQKIITGIWKGDIMFWGNLSEHAVKKPQFYSRTESDAFSRLRVPMYIKTFEFVFFTTFLILYYMVLMERNPYQITIVEVLLYIWFAAFAYDEFSEFMGAGTMVYSVDIWNGFDSIIILIGTAFVGTRVVGLIKHDDAIIDIAFDILSLEGLFMVPRLCSLLSLIPYFATLVKDFVKFMVIVGILYLGFLTTFTLLARDSFTFGEMSWILTRVFFGKSELGFGIMSQINPKLGPPLMLIFNLLPLLFIKPFHILFPSLKLRKTRILILKITHIPIVSCIWLYEHIPGRIKESGEDIFSSDLPETTQILIDSTRAQWAKNRNQQAYFSGAVSKKNSSTPSKRPSHVLVSGDVPTNPGISRESTLTANCAKDLSAVKDRERELEDKVANLSVQIAQLTALIMKSQGLENT